MGGWGATGPARRPRRPTEHAAGACPFVPLQGAEQPGPGTGAAWHSPLASLGEPRDRQSKRMALLSRVQLIPVAGRNLKGAG